jgi:hypothetical protein
MDTNSLIIQEVKTNKQQKDFFRVPLFVYADSKAYIRPLDKDIENIFNPKVNENFKYGKAIRWVVYENSKPVGKIAAFYSQKPREMATAGIGFFDSIQNQKVAYLLLDTAKNWIKSNGFDSFIGPINFGERDSFWGLLVKGFHESPSYGQNYNPPYYQSFFEEYGFIIDFEQTTSKITLANFETNKFETVSKRVFANPNYKILSANEISREKLCNDFLHIYNTTWPTVYENFKPLDKKNFLSIMSKMLQVAHKELNLILYEKQEPIGFFITIMDVNQIFRKFNGKLGLIQKIQFLLSFNKINKVKGLVFGVVPSKHNLGLEVALLYEMYRILRKEKFKHIETAELAWVGSFNPKMLALFNKLKVEENKKHITYRYNFN